MCPYSNPYFASQTNSFETKDLTPGKWEEDEQSDPKPLSFGQKAVSYSIMTDDDPDMHRIKSYMAELIDIIDLRLPQSRASTEYGFIERMMKDDAIRKLMDACDAAIKYIDVSK